MKIKQSIAVILLFVVASASHATRLFLEAGIHAGGDEITAVDFFGNAESIKAGELVSGSVGLISELNESIELRTSIGVKLGFVAADNGDLDFTRVPVEAMFFTSNGKSVNFGAGLTYHINPKFNADDLFLASDVSFDDALGFVAEVDFKLGEKGYIGIKLTSIDYETKNSGFGTTTIDGNSVGIVIGISF